MSRRLFFLRTRGFFRRRLFLVRGFLRGFQRLWCTLLTPFAFIFGTTPWGRILIHRHLNGVLVILMGVRATLPSALNVMNASSVGKLVQLVTASRLTLNHEG